MQTGVPEPVLILALWRAALVYPFCMAATAEDAVSDGRLMINMALAAPAPEAVAPARVVRSLDGIMGVPCVRLRRSTDDEQTDPLVLGEAVGILPGQFLGSRVSKRLHPGLAMHRSGLAIGGAGEGTDA